MLSPNLFHNPLTSGLNSAKHSPVDINRSNQFNNTATFANGASGGVNGSGSSGLVAKASQYQ